MKPSPGKPRRRVVKLNQELIFTRHPGPDRGKETVRLQDMIRLNLSPGRELLAGLSRIDQTEDSFTWVGHIKDPKKQGTVSFTRSGELLLGRIDIYGEGLFSIIPRGNSLFEIVELDFSWARLLPPVYPPERLLDSEPRPSVEYAGDEIIEIMVVWSEDAEEAAIRQGSSIQAEIALAVSLINTTYANSGINQRVSLVASSAADYLSQESSIEDDLYRLQSPNDGFMDGIHKLRQASGADCVSLITNGYPGNIVGIGYALKPAVSGYFYNYAFAVVDRHAFFNQTLTHELGHLMGAGHELDNPSSPGPQYYSYSSGFHYEADPGEHWHTMMSYQHYGENNDNPSYKISHFSNPVVDYGGNPTGLPGPDGNNNALTLNNTMSLVDSFGENLDPDLAGCYPGSSSFQPGSIHAGEDLEISIRICNFGYGPATGFTVDFYASPDLSIDSGDYLLGTAHSAGISLENPSLQLEWTGPLPDGIPPGNFHLGWIIDAGNDISESNESNNEIVLSSPTLNVTAPLQCSYNLYPSSSEFTASGGNGSFEVSSPAGCLWTAQSQAGWIAISTGSSGSGNGTVAFTVSQNNSYSPRVGSIKVQDRYFTVNQNPLQLDCIISLDPKGRSHPPEGGSGSVGVSTDPSCSWTAQSQAEWITLSPGSSGTGSGTFSYSITANPGPEERAGLIQVEEASFTVTQESSFTELEKNDQVIFPADFTQFGGLLKNTFVGATVLNIGSTPKQVTFSSRDRQGRELETNGYIPGLPAGGQLARLTTELIDDPAGASTIIAEGEGTNPPLRSIFVVGDNQTRRLDGIGNTWQPSREIYLLPAWSAGAQQTALFLYNTSTTEQAEVVLEWKGEDGTSIDLLDLDISPEGTLFQTLSDLFSNSSEPGSGYIRASSTTKICGFVLSGTDNHFTSFPSQLPKKTENLYAPHFILLPDGKGTELQLLNAGDSPVSLRGLALVGSESTTTSATIEILPGHLLRGPLVDYFPFPVEEMEPDQILTGRIRFDLEYTENPGGEDPPEVIGGVVLKGGENNSSGLPLESRGWENTIFPHVAQSKEMEIFTGLAVWNVNPEAAEVTIRAWDHNGVLAAETVFVLEPGQRRIGLLNESFYFGSGFSQVGGHLEINGSLPLVSFCLYGDFSLEYLSSIGGQELSSR